MYTQVGIFFSLLRLICTGYYSYSYTLHMEKPENRRKKKLNCIA